MFSATQTCQRDGLVERGSESLLPLARSRYLQGWMKESQVSITILKLASYGEWVKIYLNKIIIVSIQVQCYVQCSVKSITTYK